MYKMSIWIIMQIDYGFHIIMNFWLDFVLDFTNETTNNDN